MLPRLAVPPTPTVRPLSVSELTVPVMEDVSVLQGVSVMLGTDWIEWEQDVIVSY